MTSQRSPARPSSLRKPFTAMLSLTAWSIGLMTRVAILWCYNLVLSPITRHSIYQYERMELRWDRLCDEAEELLVQGEELHTALRHHWNL
jgi:hypothetical protein